MKYIIILVLVLISAVYFFNKNKDTVAYIDGNQAATVKATSTDGCSLHVSKVGDGKGVVNPMGFKKYKCGTKVNITAKPTDATSYIGIWGGDCAKALNGPDCTVTVDSNKYVIAKINKKTIVNNRNSCTKISKDEYIENIMKSKQDPEIKKKLIDSALSGTADAKFNWCWFWSF